MPLGRGKTNAFYWKHKSVTFHCRWNSSLKRSWIRWRALRTDWLTGVVRVHLTSSVCVCVCAQAVPTVPCVLQSALQLLLLTNLYCKLVFFLCLWQWIWPNKKFMSKGVNIHVKYQHNTGQNVTYSYVCFIVETWKQVEMVPRWVDRQSARVFPGENPSLWQWGL